MKVDNLELDEHERRMIISALHHFRGRIFKNSRQSERRGFKPADGKADVNVIKLRTLEGLLRKMKGKDGGNGVARENGHADEGR